MATTVSATSAMWLMKSDIMAAAAGGLFKYAFPSYPLGSMEMVAIESLIISVLARVLPNKVAIDVGGFDEARKSAAIVGILGAALAAYKKHNPLQGAVGAISIDCMANEFLTILGMADGDLLSK